MKDQKMKFNLGELYRKTVRFTLVDPFPFGYDFDI